MAGSTSNENLDKEFILSYFNELSFSQPLAQNLLSTSINALSYGTTGDELKNHLGASIPSEAFALQEVMESEKFYDPYRTFLNHCNVDTPST